MCLELNKEKHKLIEILIIPYKVVFEDLYQMESKNLTYECNSLDERSVIHRYQCHMVAKFGVYVTQDCNKLPTLY